MTGAEVCWRVFRTGLLRSAGFPFEWLDELGNGALEDHATQFVKAHITREIERARTLDVLWSIRRREAEKADVSVINRAIRRVRSGKTVTGPNTDVSAATTRWNGVAARFDSLRESFGAEIREMLLAEYERERTLLFQYATSNDFKDAVLLSSPSVYKELVRASEQQAFHGKRAELTAYRFLQRFCAKNESGGSIGPVNLISIGSERTGAPTRLSRFQYIDDPVLGRVNYVGEGDGRSAERKTFVSYWAACEIGNSLLTKDVDARYTRRPYPLLGAPRPALAELDAGLLSAIDGDRSVSTLASVMALPVETVDAAVSHLAALGLVEDSWRAPYFTTDAGEDLRKLAEQVGTPDAKRACRFVQDVKKFAQVPCESRPRFLSAITREFTQLTDQSAWRGGGQIQADRAVLYEEAMGNVRDAQIDPAGAKQLAQRLSTSLDFLASLAIEKRAAGQTLLRQEMTRRGVDELPATEVRDMTVDVPDVSPHHVTLRERFLRMLDPMVPSVEFSRHDLVEAGLVRDDLDDWPVFGAADVMLIGSNDDSATDPGRIILGELHHLWPTLACWVRAIYGDSVLGNQELWPIVARELAPAVPTLQEIVREAKATDTSPFGHAVLCLDTGMPLPDAVTIPAERAVVRRWPNGFIGLHDPDGQRDLWLQPDYDTNGVSVGGLAACAIPALHLKSFTLGRCTPRIVIDGVVVQRRRWEVEAAEIPGAGIVAPPTEQEWLALQIWRHGIGLPRRTYVLLDSESKPTYLDFSSVLSVNNFLRSLRSTQQVILTEALPEPEQLWLRTKDGTLTSEIRTLLWRDRRSIATPTDSLS